MYRFILFFSLLFISLPGQITEKDLSKIDKYFTDWNKNGQPGGVIGIMQDGKVLFSKAYGLASLEYSISNNVSTKFNIASVSKQFTAMGIVLLHLQAKLSVDDNIKKYLPELPDFAKKITIRHMLHHTSGLRSLHDLFGIAGWRWDDTRTNEDLYRIISRQKDLNFKPGDEYMYCNTGYMLMAKIIERISGEKFAQWTKKAIFDPLGLHNTYVEDDYRRIVPNNATSYLYSRRNGFRRAVEFWAYVGSGNIHSTITDLLNWMENFYNPKPAWEKAFKFLETIDKLNNGNDNNYAFGINVDRFKDYKRIQHGGSIGGFRSFVCAYPDKKMSIVLLSNFSNASPRSKVERISEELFAKKGLSSDMESVETIKLLPDDLKKFEAYYWNDKENFARRVYLKNDTLRYFRSRNRENALEPVSENEFRMIGAAPGLRVKFETGNDNKKKMTVSMSGNSPVSYFTSYNKPFLSKKDLEQYEGEYYSPELEVNYIFWTEKKTLFARQIRHGTFKLNLIKKDVLEGPWPLRTIKFQRDTNGKISGIYVSNGRVRNLWLKKL